MKLGNLPNRPSVLNSMRRAFKSFQLDGERPKYHFCKSQKIESAKQLLLNGSTIRQVSRIVGLNHTTVLRLAKSLGLSAPTPINLTTNKTLSDKSAGTGGTRFRNQFPIQPWEKVGLCACGCGGKTTQAKHDDHASGVKAGGFYRFIASHQWKLRRTLFKPPNWKSTHEIMCEREAVRRKLALAANTLRTSETPTYDDLRKEFGGVVILNGREVNNQGLGRMLTIASRTYADVVIPRIIVPKKRMFEVAPISEFYPYISRNLTREEQLLGEVNNAVPKHLYCRADVCQDLLLALLSAEITLDGLKEHVPIFIRKHQKMFNTHMVSLDQKVRSDGESESSLLDLIGVSNNGELYGIVKGGVNWQTASERFEMHDPLSSPVWDIMQTFMA